MIKLTITYRLIDNNLIFIDTTTDDLYDIANIMMDNLPIDIDYVKKITIKIEGINEDEEDL